MAKKKRKIKEEDKRFISEASDFKILKVGPGKPLLTVEEIKSFASKSKKSKKPTREYKVEYKGGI